MSNEWQQTAVRDSRSAAARPDAAAEDNRRVSAPGASGEGPSRSERSAAAKPSGNKRKRKRKRSFWLTLLRWTIVPILLFWSIVAGLYVGYSVLGKQSGGEVFQMQTWKHLYDLMFSNS